ncbi:MAG: metallophosphoesterase family protein [Bacteroidota bacterium]|uniref:Metallophosphoesterase family protein n=1 Tax=Flagellimonas okinawensis TaxID=3031324 RepID=A0ABT5XMH7_9FLAO|nr:metallophosphoesterase family protein [[Muricauda] okinawensis]MDF0707094.1 metallophosphoesterase family protein [[Muricauda] okinawensis]MEC8832835.1 metallophosphoesterase family protein [Bacteroidota bacterium]
MRTLVVGDIHSGVRALEQLITKAKVSQSDHIIFLGDYVDAWSTAVETIDFLIQLQDELNCTFIRGNHDELCREWLMHQKENPQWLAHGGTATRDSYLKASRDTWEAHLRFYEELKNYYLAEDNRLFLHAGYTNLKGIDFEYFEQSFYWDRTLWELATALDPELTPSDSKFPKRLTHYKEVFIGHTPLSKNSFVQPQKRANVWNVDTGAAFKGGLTMLDVESKEYWQSDPVHTFYPGEKGRN